MGFKVPRKTARLQFEGDEFDNCEIVVALDITFEVGEHIDRLQSAQDEEKHQEALGFFADNCILSWNLEDANGKALPVSAGSFRQFPVWFGTLILNHWKEELEKLSEVPGPLDEPLKNGSTPAAQSAMTEAPLSAPESLPAPSP